MCVVSGASYIFLNSALLLLALGGYFYPKILSYALAALSWLILYPAMIIMCGIDALSGAVSLVLFNILLISSVVYKSAILADKREYGSRLKDREDLAKEISSRLKEAYEIEDSTREGEIAVVKLYEITKRMSAALRFEEIFAILADLLKENFTFRRSELLLLNYDEDGLKVKKTFIVWGADIEAVGEQGINYDELVKLTLETKDGAYFARNAAPEIFHRLNISDKARTFATIPLMVEKKMAGILVIEDLPYIDLERALIVAMQFAFEVKKVLLYEKVEELAITDGLTGLYVRRYFMERMEGELNRSRRYSFNFAFLMIDIDNFKRCNDTYGHLVGDVILKNVARVIRESTREIDLVARYGGEEFAVVLPETTRDGAKYVAERIAKLIEGLVFKAYDESLKLTVSVGVAVYPEDSGKMTDLIDKADSALYVSKKSGKNLVSLYKK